MARIGGLLWGRVTVGLVVVAAALVVAVPGSAMPAAGVNFLAMGTTNTASIVTGAPPDPSGAVGPNDYVEAVNGGIEVFNKSGGVLAAAKQLNTLWTGYVGTNPGNQCATHNDGDPIVRYDRLADRWLITQFSLPNENNDVGPSFQCVAVSKTSDPTGAYWLYDFKYPYAINDYAKIGVWPDAYYATYNMFSTSAYMGADICAWDRTAMLNGQPATQQCFLLSYPSSGTCQTVFPASIVPANADGSLPPPSGSPEYLMQFNYPGCSPPYDELDLWKLHIDWTTPANSTLSAPTALSVSSFTPACYSAGAPNCIPQPGSTTTLDGLDDRLMDRLVYRNYGTYQSLFLNHTVSAGAGAGIRWYEIRSPDTTPTVFQQGTYAPADNNWRFMGSIAADQAGDVALGYSVSASSGGVSHPSIAWTGRLAGDALGTMGQGETILNIGSQNAPDEYTGSPDQHRARWGDYTSMTVDPTDDCTFWYANEVQATTSATGWNTYIQSFTFPNCGQNDFTIAPTGGVTALQGTSGTTSISTGLSKGTAESVQLSAFNLPTGATASFDPSTVTAGGSSTLTLTAGASTPPGAYTVEVAGTAPSAVHGTAVTFTVNAAHTLTVTKSVAGAGTVTSAPTGIDCGATCSAPFASGTPVTLTATPDSGSVFLGWSGDCAGTSTCPLTMSADRAAAATFDGVPSCTDGSASTGHDTAAPLALSCSDPDAGDNLTYAVVAGPSHGNLGSIDSSGHVTYTPTSGYSGPDSFTFKVTDGHSVDSNTATMSLTVHVAAPTCTDRSASTAHNTGVLVNLPCSGPAAFTDSIVSPPSHGNLGVIDGSGNVTYTPDAGFAGQDTFTYKATDTSSEDSNVATATVTVGANHAPTCSDQTISVPHNAAKQIVLDCADADPGNTLGWSIVTLPGHGTLSAIDGSGGLTYTPSSGFGGLDRFTFKATDNEGADSNVATINLNVAKLVPCFGLTGAKLRACKAKLRLQADLKKCARIKAKTTRNACVKAAKRRYHHSLRAATHVPRVAPTGHRPPLLLYMAPLWLLPPR